MFTAVFGASDLVVAFGVGAAFGTAVVSFIAETLGTRVAGRDTTRPAVTKLGAVAKDAVVGTAAVVGADDALAGATGVDSTGNAVSA